MKLVELYEYLERIKYKHNINNNGVLSKDCLRMLEDLTYSSDLLDHIKFLLKVVVAQSTNTVTINESDLEKENKILRQKVDELEKIISTYNQHYVQRAKAKAGVKIAAKPLEVREKAFKLIKEGSTQTAAAKACGVSRGTIIRWLKGVDIDGIE